MDAPEGAAWAPSTEKSDLTPYRGPRARSPAVGSAYSPATPQALPCPRAHHAPAAKATPDIPLPRTPCHLPRTEGQGSAETRSLVKFSEKSGTHPLLRVSARSPAREPATPRIRKTRRPLAARRHHTGRSAGRCQKARTGCAEGTEHGSARERSRDRSQAPQKSAGRRSMTQITEKSGTHPHAAGPLPLSRRGLRPLPCRAAGASLPVSPPRPGCQSHSGHPAAPHHRHPPRTEGQGRAERRSMDVP